MRSILDLLIVGGTAAAVAFRERLHAPAEKLATKPRPIDAALVAMLKARRGER